MYCIISIDKLKILLSLLCYSIEIVLLIKIIDIIKIINIINIL